MRTCRLNSLSRLVFVLVIVFTIVLFATVSEARAQEGNPPPTIVPQVVGGTLAMPGEWPWQVALVGGSVTNFFTGQFCGGSLIHPQWVITAAHCVTSSDGSVSPPSAVDIVAGVYNLSSPAPGYQRRDVIQIIRHPSYNRFTLNNDIALLKLASSVTIGGSGETSTALVQLAPASVGSLAGVNSWVTGWGTIQQNPDARPSQLYEVQLPIYANSVCNDSNHWGGGITDNMLCAGRDSGGISSCFGDSGGPLVVPDGGGGWYLAGITSFGSYLCGAPRTPSVFTRVSQYGTWVNQNIGLTTLGSPSGAIGTNYTPTYTWNAVSTMTYYYLYVNGPNGNVIKKWFTAVEAGCSNGTGTCSVTPTINLGGGAHTWWVQTWNPAGYGPWSAGKTFSTTIPDPPAGTTLFSPSGAIGVTKPTYTWEKVSEATWYYLWINGPSGNVFKQWYEASAVCGDSTCSVTPDKALSAGNYTFWIQTWNLGGYGPWSSGMSFSLSLPGAATLTSPSGNIAIDTPTYTWNEVPDATWYYLWINGPSGTVFKQWYEAAVICGESTCSAASAKALSAGAHTFWVQTWNPGGYGPWSDGMSFTPAPPGAATLVSPNGSISTNKPTYAWDKVAGTTWYYLWVNGPSGNVIKQWYQASEVCNEGMCSITPDVLLNAGNHTFWVQTWSNVGYGPWSEGMNFTVSP